MKEFLDNVIRVTFVGFVLLCGGYLVYQWLE